MLANLGVSQSVRDRIVEKQSKQWRLIVELLKEPKQFTEVDEDFNNFKESWNDNALLAVATYYVGRGLEIKVKNTLMK